MKSHKKMAVAVMVWSKVPKLAKRQGTWVALDSWLPLGTMGRAVSQVTVWHQIIILGTKQVLNNAF